MAEICRFFGIIVRMYSETGGQHHAPHFHVYYTESVAVYSIDPIALVTGSLPTRQRRLLEAWAELHQHELLDDWRRLDDGDPPLPIPPLA